MLAVIMSAISFYPLATADGDGNPFDPNCLGDGTGVYVYDRCLVSAEGARDMGCSNSVVGSPVDPHAACLDSLLVELEDIDPKVTLENLHQQSGWVSAGGRGFYYLGPVLLKFPHENQVTVFSVGTESPPCDPWRPLASLGITCADSDLVPDQQVREAGFETLQVCTWYHAVRVDSNNDGEPEFYYEGVSLPGDCEREP